MYLGGGTGDSTTITPTNTTDVYDSAGGTIDGGPPMLVGRWNHDSVSLGAKGILVTGGWTTSTGSETSDSELLDLTVGVPCSAGCASGLTCHDGVCCTTATCPTGETCNAPGHEGVCTKPKGAACTSNLECATGYCVTGFCCDGPCAGTCKACNIAGSEGTCVLAAAGTDPGGVCGVGSPSPDCGRKCDGTGKCGGDAPSGAFCGLSLTDGGGPFCSVQTCDGFGDCISTTNTCGLTCTTAVTCDETTKTCSASATGIKAGYCVIDSTCWTYGDINPKNACQNCDPPTTKTDWTAIDGCDAGPDGGGDGGSDATTDGGDATTDAGGDAKTDAADAKTDAADAKTDGGDAKTDAPSDAPSDTSSAADTTVEDDSGTGGDTSSSSGCGCHVVGEQDESNEPRLALAAIAGLALVVARRRKQR
jgi:MYXO-CTERM domain-containing protein